MNHVRDLFLFVFCGAVLAIGVANCAGKAPNVGVFGVVLFAQTLPATLHAQWTPNPASDNISDYQLRLDGGAPVTEALANCTPTLCRVTFTVPAFGAHAVTISARNLKLSADPTSLQEGPQTAPMPFTLNQAPQTAPTGGAVTQ